MNNRSQSAGERRRMKTTTKTLFVDSAQVLWDTFCFRLSREICLQSNNIYMQCITYTFSCQTLTPVQAGKVTQLRLNAVNPIFK